MSQTEIMDLSIMEKVVIQGDLSRLTPQERLVYYTKLCESLGLNPLTKPFDYLMLDKKLVLYAKKDCTDQLRKMQKISVNIASRERIGDVYCVTARATAPDGRFDESMGVVSLTKKETVWDEKRNRYVATGNIIPLSGDDLANALMKAETKSKRRVTLSIVGLGMLDETEIETMPEIQQIVDEEPLGEIQKNQEPKEPAKSQQAGRQAQKETRKPQSQSGATPNPTPAPTHAQAGTKDIYQLLDFKTGISPGGVTFAKMKVVNLTFGQEEIFIVREPSVIEQTGTIQNTSKFNLDIQEENGFKLVQGIQIVGEAA